MRKSKYYTKEDYFTEINQNSAYILGFIVGDGNIGINDSGNYYLQIRLNSKDLEVLEFIRNELSPDRKINFFKIKQKSGYISEMIHCKITSNKLCKDLIKYGVVPKKTGKEIFPKINEQYIPDFLRGYFDADGCLTIKKKKHYVFSYVCANKEYLEQIKKYFGFGKIVKGHGKCFTYYVSNLENILKIGTILYNDGFCLKRKKERFDNMPKSNKYEAFGEFKTLKNWAKDARCLVSYDGLRYRVNNTNLSMEECLTTALKAKNGNMYSRNKIKERKHTRNNYSKIEVLA